MNDPDNIRVDLLKFRRKAYLSYPEGSLERKSFLKALLQNELTLTKQEIPTSLINFVLESNSIVSRHLIIQILLWGSLVILSDLLYFFLLPHLYAFLFLIPSAMGLYQTTTNITKYWLYRKSLKTVKDYSNEMKTYISKISDDIKKLEGPRGF